MRKKIAIILVSGGMDSCVTAALAHSRFTMAFLHVNYGQRTQKRELQAFHAIADYYKVKTRLCCDLDFLGRLGGSSLTDENIPVAPADLSRKEIPASYVPFRNTHILSIAVSWAEIIRAGKIFIGAVEEDSSGYPDCREVYFQAFNRLIEAGTRPETHIEVVTPLIGMSKKEIILRGMELKAPLHLTWSCYQGEEEACGECDSCALRLRGFREAGVPDPIPYSPAG